MKTLYFILLTLVIVLAARGADPVFIEEFKKMGSMDQEKLIQQASPDQKKALIQAKIHLDLLKRWGGEVGLKAQKESQVASIRGFVYIEGVFNVYGQIWDRYLGDVWQTNKKAGMTQEQLESAEKKLRDERDSFFSKRLQAVHSLVFNMAVSPQALELEKKAEQLDDEMTKEFGLPGSTPYHPVTRDQLMSFKHQMDQIFEEMKKLPTLMPEELQKEYDAFPDEKITR